MTGAKYQGLLEMLRTDILSGKYRSEQPFPSVRALVRRFGIARSTVQHALEELAHQGLISRSQGAGSFVTRHGSSRRIGLIVPGVAYCEIYPPIVSEISRLAQEAEYKLFIGDVQCADSLAWARRAKRVAEDLVREGVSGVVFQPIESMAEADACNREVLSVFKDADVPVVLIGYDIVTAPRRSEYDVVGIGNFDAGSRLAEHLLSVGAQRIHFLVKRGENSPSARARIMGVGHALGPRRFAVARNVLESAPDDADRIRRHIRLHRPDAFVCGNDAVAAAFRQTLEQMGLDVPDDILLAGFDDVNIARLTRLTTVRQPCQSMARMAFRRLLERIGEPAIEPVEMLLTAPLVERESTTGAIRKKLRKERKTI